MNTAERGHPPSRPQPGPPPARGGPRRLPAENLPDIPQRQPARGGSVGRASAGIEPVASRGPRRLAKPKPVRVGADATGRPQKIGKREVDAVRESWLVEDRWWTDEPLRRRYWEAVTGDGRDPALFPDPGEGGWDGQR